MRRTKGFFRIGAGLVAAVFVIAFSGCGDAALNSQLQRAANEVTNQIQQSVQQARQMVGTTDSTNITVNDIGQSIQQLRQASEGISPQYDNLSPEARGVANSFLQQAQQFLGGMTSTSSTTTPAATTTETPAAETPTTTEPTPPVKR